MNICATGLSDRFFSSSGFLAPRLGSPSTRSLDLGIEKFLRAHGVHVGLGNKISAGINSGRHLFAFRGSECGLDAIITHTERVLHHERGDRTVLQEFDELFVRVEADEIDLVPRLVRLALD
jgi:hypothetical protein